MGLIYDSADSNNVMTALSGNLSAARSAVDQTEHACNRLLGTLGNGELSGEGYNAIAILFSQALLPSVKASRLQLESLEKDLATYTWEDSKISRFGVLKEDQLATQLEATRTQRDATERLMEVNEAFADAMTAVPLLGDALRMANSRLEMALNHLEKEARDLEDRLGALRHFDSATRGLFQTDLIDSTVGTTGGPSATAAVQPIGSIQPASLAVPAAGATIQQIVSWLTAGGYSIAELIAACGPASVMAALALIVIGGVGTGSTSGSQFYTPEEQIRRSQARWYYYTHNLDGSLKQHIGPVPTGPNTYFNEEAGFDDVEKILDEKTRPGRTEPNREVDTVEALDELGEQISRGGKAIDGPASYQGTWVELPDGTRIGRRRSSNSGGPTIDIKPPQGDPIKVHLPKGWGK